MKRILWAFAVLCLNPFVLAQGSRYDSQVTTVSSNVPSGANAPVMAIPGSRITVCASTGCPTLAPIYSNSSLTVPTSNPFLTNTQGKFGFWATPGNYFLQVQNSVGTVLSVSPITVGGGAGGGATLPTNAPVYGLTATTSRPAIAADIVNLWTTCGTNFLKGDGTCAPGGGAAPVGSLKVQASNNGGSALHDTNMTIDNVTTPTYVDANSPLSSFGTNAVRTFNGVPYIHQKQCYENLASGSVCDLGYYATSKYGWNFGNGGLPGSFGWSVSQNHVRNNMFWKPGISQSLTSVVDKLSDGDSVGLYSYLWSYGGNWDNSGEGSENLVVFGGASSDRTFVAIANGSSAGATDIVVSPTNNNPIAHALLVDVTHPIATTCSTVAVTINTATLSGCALTPALNIGTTIDPISITDPSNSNGTVLSITTHLDSGSGFPTTRAIYFACDSFDGNYVRATNVTAPDGSGNQIITGTFWASCPSGVKVFDDPANMNAWIYFNADSKNGFPTGVGYMVAGALDSTHVYYRSFGAAVGSVTNQTGIINFKHNFGLTLNSIPATRVANVTTLCFTTPIFSGQQVTIAGGTASFDGNFTLSNGDNVGCSGNFAVHYPNTGADDSTAVNASIGGAVGGSSGLGATRLYPGATVQYVDTVSVTVGDHKEDHFTGKLHLYPNNYTFLSGSQLTSPFLTSISYIGAAIRNTINQPTTQNTTVDIAENGSSYTGIFQRNTTPDSEYVGGGEHGTMSPGIAHQIIGAHVIERIMTSPLSNSNLDNNEGVIDYVQASQACKVHFVSCKYLIHGLEDYTGVITHLDEYDSYSGVRTISPSRYGGAGLKMFPIGYSTAARADGFQFIGSHIGISTTNTNPCDKGVSLDTDGNVTLLPCGSSGPTIQTNGANNTLQTTLNFITSTANSIGLTATPSNPATGNEKVEITGSLTTGGITNAAVTLAKIQNAAANSKLVGSGASGSGAAYSEITLGTNLSMSGTTLNATAGGGGNTTSTTLTTNTLPKANGPNSIIDSALSDNGTTLTYAGSGAYSSYQIGLNLFSALPTCNSGTEGSQAPITDSSSNTWGATITGGSTNHVLAYCNGTNWTVAAK